MKGGGSMYVPRHFNVTDVEEIRGFIRKNSFGTIVSTEEGKPIATHIPLELHKQGDDYYVTGHMAYANRQWKTFANGNDHVLIMFQGPHAYVSSTWYKDENVPTWNYQAVHVYGIAQIMNEEELEEDLRLLLQEYEHHRESPVLWENLSAQTKKQIKGIVGFKIKVEEVQAQYKLSQNRTDNDYANIIAKLYEEEDVLAHQIADIMKKDRNGGK